MLRLLSTHPRVIGHNRVYNRRWQMVENGGHCTNQSQSSYQFTDLIWFAVPFPSSKPTSRLSLDHRFIHPTVVPIEPPTLRKSTHVSFCNWHKFPLKSHYSSGAYSQMCVNRTDDPKSMMMAVPESVMLPTMNGDWITWFFYTHYRLLHGTQLCHQLATNAQFYFLVCTYFVIDVVPKLYIFCKDSVFC